MDHERDKIENVDNATEELGGDNDEDCWDEEDDKFKSILEGI